MSIDLAEVRGVPECALGSLEAGELPPNLAPAPWIARATGMFWWGRPNDAARDALRAALPAPLTALRPVFVAAALISYSETPVGAYHEVLAIVSLRHEKGSRRGVVSHVPFIAVDSAPSVVGGRANWALPKVLADFTGEPIDRTTMTASGPGWTISATPRATRVPLPFASPRMHGLTQYGPDDAQWRAKSSGRGVVKLAKIDVTVSSTGSLAAWLPTGSCRGALAVSMRGWMGPSAITPAR